MAGGFRGLSSSRCCKIVRWDCELKLRLEISIWWNAILIELFTPRYSAAAGDGAEFNFLNSSFEWSIGGVLIIYSMFFLTILFRLYIYFSLALSVTEFIRRPSPAIRRFQRNLILRVSKSPEKEREYCIAVVASRAWLFPFHPVAYTYIHQRDSRQARRIRLSTRKENDYDVVARTSQSSNCTAHSDWDFYKRVFVSSV